MSNQSATAEQITSLSAVADGVKSAHEQNELAIASLTLQVQAKDSRISQLEKVLENVKTTPKLPVSDADLESAIVKLENINKADRSVLGLSLVSVLKFSPEFTDAQKKLWQARKAVMVNAHSAYVKAQAGLITATLKRAAKMPHAILAGGIRKNKEGKVTGATLRASKMAGVKKAKPRAKGAVKPTVSSTAKG